MQNFPQRRSHRLKDYDYRQCGLYYVTICTDKRDHLFGEISHSTLQLSREGEIVIERWLWLAKQ
jgi:putative transposase